MHVIRPRTATERAAYITDAFNAGERLRTADVAERCGVTRQGAYRLLDAISGVVPLLLVGGVWQRLPRQQGVDMDVLR